MKRILVVEDEPSIVTLIKFNLEQAGFFVLTAEDGNTGLQLAVDEKPDLIVLDIMLPGMDGIEICKALRQEKNMTPIVMLTARDDELDKVLGLELGADDYLTKPFSPRELIARIKAVLRRTKQDDKPEIENRMTIGELTIDTEKYEVALRGKPLELTPKEFELLIFLANHQGKVLSRDQLLNGVWDFEYDGDTRIVDVHVSHLREKIEDDTKQPKYIKTIRGFGYKMEGP
ncbi:response regulator [Pueribacillus sp. YX66]|uniref:response regulator n=1 Tax=Pueribacillus sp. YX66 TaxID=3229242 RepID=UPI00358D0282